MTYAVGTPGASAARLAQGRLYGVFGNVKDATGRGFRSSCDLSENAKALASMFSSRTPVAALPENNKQNMKIMSASTSAEAVPKWERVITNWRRFSMGLWRVPEGDIAAAYSASSLPKVTVFTHEGCLYTNGGSNFSKWLHAEVNGHPLIPADEYRGAESVPYSYEGREVAYKGKIFRLGAKLVFVASDPTIEEWRQSARVLYGEGGMFAADCTYTEFIGNRFDPQSENGRAARFKELAECGARPMPRTQEEMLRLLAQETGFTNQPQQIDFAL